MNAENAASAEPALNSVISARSLVKRYKNSANPALNDFTLEVQRGEFFGLLGPNGAGKTTAISILTGLFPPDSGTVQIMGLDFQNKGNAIKQILGLVPQNIGLYDQLSARENLSFFGQIFVLLVFSL